VSVFGGLDLCSCKRGFFTLRDCANSATATCRTSPRRICSQHLAEPESGVECAARQAEDRALDEPLDHAGNPIDSAVRYRTRWYRAGGYSPVFWGTSDVYWTTNDYRYYDEGGSSDDYDDDDGGGFGDS
jgi:hypothetical protein